MSIRGAGHVDGRMHIHCLTVMASAFCLIVADDSTGVLEMQRDNLNIYCAASGGNGIMLDDGIGRAGIRGERNAIERYGPEAQTAQVLLRSRSSLQKVIAQRLC
jgi:hypothetical protein